ncbi:RNA-binding protein [Grosmannia clavigera kw1407]|uniref:RNA-binding protein n=1 Tax=Grosmannia clavigera (strain kw1407 / UAMH 11150) TaxID=655863 RepID=F0XHD8_GROCL|nr:RNA-binding protein [Grosmannia clavigera kw1407]EFX03142.1 RNA-binding protein [Grosmannia clavigera kw1407]
MRGEATQNKVHYRGSDEDYIVFVDDVATYRKWKEDSSVPLAHFVSSFKVFVTHNQGVQGTLDTASNGTLENEFSTHDIDAVLKSILSKGTLQEVEGPERQGFKNDSQGARVAH